VRDAHGESVDDELTPDDHERQRQEAEHPAEQQVLAELLPLRVP